MTTKPAQIHDIQPRFVLLHHAMEAAAGRFDHWDLMLEHTGTLITFELDRLPSGPAMFETRRLADHRMTYLDFEGHISGNRGQVFRLDRGRYQEFRVEEIAAERAFHYKLEGQRLTACICANQPLFMLPFGMPVELEATEWNWHD